MSEHDMPFERLSDRDLRRSFAAPAASAVRALIDEGAKILVAEPWRVARIVRGADCMTFADLCAEIARRRRGGPPADFNAAIAFAQLTRAMKTTGFDAAWTQWRAERGGL